MVRIAEIQAGSIADELELRIGSRIVRINGTLVRDTLDFRFLEADSRLEVEVSRDGGAVLYDIEKAAGESLGVVPAPDAVRECANKCVFCFIDGNPPGVRQSLYLRDDDFRLSFTYGSYVTLTNLGPRGFQRLVEQRLSPLYVSVHATEPEVRMRLLAVPRGGDIVDRLRDLADAGIDVHTQVVLCPGWNDGAHLDRTLEDLWSLGPRILSVSVVPVGLTRYNLNRPVRLLERDEAARALEQVDAARGRALAQGRGGWAYAADEMFFIAGRPLPTAPYYDDWLLTENGVGAVRLFLDAFERGVAALPRLDGRRLAVVTGLRMGSVMVPLVPRVQEATGAEVSLLPVENRLFGPTVNTAGLLPGADIAAAVEEAGPFDDVLLPAESMNDDGLFIDGVSMAELRGRLAGARVTAGYDLAAAVAQL